MGQVEPQQKVFAVPPISADGGLDDIHPMRRGGVKSFVDDLVLGWGVVISRAATSLRSVETQPWTRRFVRFRRAIISGFRLEGCSDLGPACLVRPFLVFGSSCHRRFESCPGQILVSTGRYGMRELSKLFRPGAPLTRRSFIWCRLA